MTAPVLGKYSFYDGLEWKVFYPRTRYDQVVIDATTRFLRPATHTVNGKSFYGNNADVGIMLYPSDIPMSNESGAQTLAQFLTNFPTASNMVTAGNALTNGKIVVGSGNKNVGVSSYSVTDIIAIANGMSKSLVLSYGDTRLDDDVSVNNKFNSNDSTITLSSSEKIIIKKNSSQNPIELVYVTYLMDNYKVGDVVWVTETEVPDRWISAITNNSITLSKLETQKVDLTDYATWGTTLAHYGIVDAVDLSSNQKISGVKTFESANASTTPMVKIEQPNANITRLCAGSIYMTAGSNSSEVHYIHDGVVYKHYNDNSFRNLMFPSEKEGTFMLTNDSHIKSASVSGNTLTLTDQNNVQTNFSGIKVSYGATSPSNPNTGDIWFDTSE